MPNFAYAVASPLPVTASGNVVAPVITGSVVLPFPGAAAGALQNVRSGTQAAAFRQQLGNTVPPVLDVSTDAYLPGYIGPNGLWTSPLLPSAGMTHCAFTVNANQGGLLIMNKYADQYGALLVGSFTTTMTASAACTVGDSTVSLFQTFSLEISNTAASGATIAAAAVLMGSK